MFVQAEVGRELHAEHANMTVVTEVRPEEVCLSTEGGQAVSGLKNLVFLKKRFLGFSG